MQEETIFHFPKDLIVDPNLISKLELETPESAEPEVELASTPQINHKKDDEIVQAATHNIVESFSPQASPKKAKFILLNDEDQPIESVFQSFPVTPLKGHNNDNNSTRQSQSIRDADIIIIDSILQQKIQMIEISKTNEQLSDDALRCSIVDSVLQQMLTTIVSTANNELTLQFTETYNEENNLNRSELADISEVVTPITAWNDCVLINLPPSKLDEVLARNLEGHIMRAEGDLIGAIHKYDSSIKELEFLIDHSILLSSVEYSNSPLISPSRDAISTITSDNTTRSSHINVVETISASNGFNNNHSSEVLHYVYFECINNRTTALHELESRSNFNFNIKLNFNREYFKLIGFKKHIQNEDIYENIMTMYRRVLKGKIRAFGPNHLQTLQVQYNLACILVEKGQITESFQLLSSTVTQFKDGGIVNCLDAFKAMSLLALLMHWTSSDEDAEALFATCTQLYAESEINHHSIEALDNLNQYANLLSEKADGESVRLAENIYQAVIDDKEYKLGKLHVSTLLSVHCLAKLYSERGSVTKKRAGDVCVELFTRAVMGYEQTLGEKHPLTLTAVHDMADYLSRSGDENDSAEVLYRRALNGRLEVLGQDHPDSLLSSMQLALLLVSVDGREIEATLLLEEVVAGRSRCFGESHLLTLQAKSLWGQHLVDSGNLIEAERCWRRCLDGFKLAVGSSHIYTVEAAKNLAKLYRDELHEYDKAIPLLDFCSSNLSRMYGFHDIIALTARRELDAVMELMQQQSEKLMSTLSGSKNFEKMNRISSNKSISPLNDIKTDGHNEKESSLLSGDNNEQTVNNCISSTHSIGQMVQNGPSPSPPVGKIKSSMSLSSPRTHRRNPSKMSNNAD